jgi:hypothetical protein
VRRTVVVAAGALALVFAGVAYGTAPVPPQQKLQEVHPGMPFHASGSVVGEGAPLKAYATIKPTVHFFGDTLQAQLAVVADTKWVDPARLRVQARFAPYTPVTTPKIIRLHIGRFEQMTWTWQLRCLTASCVPVAPPSEKYHVFRFPDAHVDYLSPNGKRAFGVDASWPRVEVISQVSPSVANALVTLRKYDWQYSLSPVLSPTYRMSPTLLYWLALGLASLLGLVALGALARWYRVLRPKAAPVETLEGSTLDRALALLAWAHANGDETLQRKAFERVASELGMDAAVDELTKAAHEMAWSPDLPEAEDVESFTEQARGQGREP